MQLQDVRTHTTAIREGIGKVIVGKEHEVDLVLATLLAGGHVLLEDVPGTGKTMLAKALSRCFSLTFGRIQFTPDLLPSELTGIEFYDPKTGEFSFRPGSLFANLILADEINRATPRTQAGLLESMEERQVTVDGVTHALPSPYFVIATQNPVETQGTFPLPEAQLDRFLIRLSLGYPTHDQSAAILSRFVTGQPLDEVSAVCTGEDLSAMQKAISTVFVHPDVYSYAVTLAEATRSHDEVLLGISTRGCIALVRLAQSWAAMQGRDFITPDDLKALAPYAFCHRMVLHGDRRGENARRVVEAILNDTAVPVENWQPGQSHVSV